MDLFRGAQPIDRMQSVSVPEMHLDMDLVFRAG